jgi:DNA transformation protein
MKRSGGDATFVSFVIEQLRSLGDVTARAMFGGHGLYLGSDFFGIVYQGRFYLRTAEADRAEFIARGMQPFAPGPRMEMVRYYEVPVEVLEDVGECARWARRAIATANAPDARRPRSRRTPTRPRG